MITVYILHSRQLDAYFAGSTKDLRRSLKKHKSGRTRSIKAALDWFPVWQQEVATSTDARAIEKQIKDLGIKSFLIEQKDSTAR